MIGDAELLVPIRRVHADNYWGVWARRVWRQLHREGIVVARCTVERLTKAGGLRGVVKVRTAKPDPAVAPGRFGEAAIQGAAAEPVVGGRFTYVTHPALGFVYVAFCIDVLSQMVTGLACGQNR